MTTDTYAFRDGIEDDDGRLWLQIGDVLAEKRRHDRPVDGWDYICPQCNHVASLMYSDAHREWWLSCVEAVGGCGFRASYSPVEAGLREMQAARERESSRLDFIGRFVVLYGGRACDRGHATIREARESFDQRKLWIQTDGRICGAQLVELDPERSWDVARVVQWLAWDRYPRRGELVGSEA